MNRWIERAIAALFSLVIMTISQPANAASKPWQINFNDPASPIARQQHAFDDFLLWIITGISIFCFVIMGYIFVRFNAKANPTPSQTTHHTGLEVAWTLVPILILVVIAVPSFRMLDDQLIVPNGERTYQGEVLPAPTVFVTATGFTWYWNYQYIKGSEYDFNFDSYIALDADLEAKRTADPGGEYPLMLAVDNEMVVPVGETVQVIVTADPEGVIHSWFVPELGVKVDAVPGRINQTWFYAEKEGLYYGACTELCGKDHSYMPIAVRAVSREAYDAWLKVQQEG